jgi:hypothetical protein
LPESPIPPNGAAELAPLVGRFQLTIPARMLAQKRLYSCGLPPISEALRPKRVLFASAIASSKLSTLITCSSGPNSSTSGRSFIAVVSMIPGETNGSSSRGRRMWVSTLPPFDIR